MDIDPIDVDDNGSSLLALPNETLTFVFLYLDHPSLVALIRACRRLQNVCEKLLYSNIDIEESVDGDPQTIVTPFQTDGCCTAVRRRPHLATSIKRISIRWTRDRARSRHQILLAPGIASALRCLLHMASYIDTLELHLAGFRGSYREILEGCTFRLRGLALSGSANAEIEWFLQLQPQLAHLQLADQHRALRLRNFDLPFLESFRGDARAAASLLPGRPVRGLALSGYEPTEQSLIACAFSRHPIRRLDLGSLSITPTQLLTISKHLTALETLRMRLALRHTLHFTFSGMMLLSALTQVLGAFQSLVYLDLSPTNVDGIRGVHNEGEENSLCRSWAGVCPSLRRVKFPSGTDWLLSGDGNWNPLR